MTLVLVHDVQLPVAWCCQSGASRAKPPYKRKQLQLHVPATMRVRKVLRRPGSCSCRWQPGVIEFAALALLLDARGRGLVACEVAAVLLVACCWLLRRRRQDSVRTMLPSHSLTKH